MKIYLTRHGEALDDIEDCYGGIADYPLTDRGREQAHAVASQFTDSGVSAIFASPLKRASETAEIIGSQLGIVPVVIADLQERNSYGVLSGVNKEKAKLVFSNVLATLKEKPGYSKELIVGAEPWDEFEIRVQRAYRAVIDAAISDGHSTIAIVTHGKFSHVLLNDVLRVDGEINLKLSAVNLIEYSPPSSRLL